MAESDDHTAPRTRRRFLAGAVTLITLTAALVAVLDYIGIGPLPDVINLAGGQPTPTTVAPATQPPATDPSSTSPTVTPAPSNGAVPTPGDAEGGSASNTDITPELPYRADWSGGMDGWFGSEDWTTVNGLLVNDGKGHSTEIGITAPLRLDGVNDYAVEAEIQLVRLDDEGAFSGVASFGVVVRASDTGGGYGAGYCVSAGIYSCTSNQPDQQVTVLWTTDEFDHTVLAVKPFQPGGSWHHYRVEVRGNSFQLLIDGSLVASGTDNTYLSGDQVGLWSSGSQLNVRNFQVDAV